MTCTTRASRHFSDEPFRSQRSEKVGLAYITTYNMLIYRCLSNVGLLFKPTYSLHKPLRGNYLVNSSNSLENFRNYLENLLFIQLIQTQEQLMQRRLQLIQRRLQLINNIQFM